MAGRTQQPQTNLTGLHGYHPDFAGEWDEVGQGFATWVERSDLARADSMELNNDPRFFSGNIIDKRLAAFHTLKIINGLMLGTSMSKCFSLKKNLDFSNEWPYTGYVQFFAFLCQMSVVFMCMISLYTIAHQLFYTYRLMTSGPTGFEAASMFYLNKTMTMWRHFSIKCLFNGLGMFIFSSGLQLFCKFIKDAEDTQLQKDQVVIDLDMNLMLGFFVFACFTLCSLFLCMLRRHHLEAFNTYYQICCTGKTGVKTITDTVRDMQHRAINLLPSD